ncbi:MAG: sulfatase-like hydrolase/transferase [Deltaproteobacteria bacterium]|nr:sulfatase-like hydrolase/transferase [Deltaproteobacteria bacterium]
MQPADTSSCTPRRGAGYALLTGALGGWLALGASGLVDGIVGLEPSAQFLPGMGDRVLFLLHLFASYGLLGALVGLVGAAAVRLLAPTELGAAVGRLRARDLRPSLTALLFVAPPLLLMIGDIAYNVALLLLATRRHVGLQLGAAMLIGAAALALFVPVAAIVALPFAAALRSASARGGPVARLVNGPATPVVVFGATALAVGAFAFGRHEETLALLPLRPLWVVLGAFVFWAPCIALGRVSGTRVASWRPWILGSLASGLVVLHLVGIIALGSLAPVGQATAQFTGLGGPLLRVYRSAIDFDGDGFSPVLGGGDCDDFNALAFPGGTEILNDGIDQNCVGGDATGSDGPGETAFVQVPPSVPRNANVLLITIDTVRADHFSSYGYERVTTPNIDALAEDGIVFENAWAHAPSTRYSMPAILTGRYPLHVYYDFSIRPWPGLLPRATTLAEMLRGRPMRTSAVTNHWYFARARAMNQGFDDYDNSNFTLHRQDARLGPVSSTGSSSKEQTDAAIAALEGFAGQRFFLWVHYYDPHFTYESHSEVESFGSTEVDRYDHEILFTDHHVGRLIDALRNEGVYDETVVVVTGDHGEGFGEHGITQHGYHLYAAQTKVPLIMRIPGVVPRRVSTAAGHVDILPTLANLVGAPPSDEMMGRSLLGLAIGETPEDPNRYVFQHVEWGLTSHHDIRGAASAECHVVHNVRPHSSWELYRTAVDPNEETNVLDDPGPCDGARSTLEAWIEWADLEAEIETREMVLRERPTIAEPVNVDVGDELRLLEVALPERLATACSETTIHLGPSRTGFRGSSSVTRPASSCRQLRPRGSMLSRSGSLAGASGAPSRARR